MSSPSVHLNQSQSLDEDCTLEEEEEGQVEGDNDIDQFNDDTFGAGAVGESRVMRQLGSFFWRGN